MADLDRNDGAGAPAEFLDSVDAAKRSSLQKLVIGTAYALPAIASFSLTGLSATSAHAYTSNISPPT